MPTFNFLIIIQRYKPTHIINNYYNVFVTLRYCPLGRFTGLFVSGLSLSRTTKSFTSLFADEIAADGIRSDRDHPG